jgi:Lrp/AsnC family transcriptional regulator for asnA, asnC and gidA
MRQRLTCRNTRPLGKLDEVDLKILACLEKDGRMSNKELSRKVNTSEGTIRNRLDRLLDNDFLRVKGLINPNKDKEKHLIILGINLIMDQIGENSAKKIVELPNAKSACLVTGAYDIIAEVYIEPSNLLTFHKQLAKLGTILTVESFIVLESYNKWI